MDNGDFKAQRGDKRRYGVGSCPVPSRPLSLVRLGARDKTPEVLMWPPRCMTPEVHTTYPATNGKPHLLSYTST